MVSQNKKYKFFNLLYLQLDSPYSEITIAIEIKDTNIRLNHLLPKKKSQKFSESVPKRFLQFVIIIFLVSGYWELGLEINWKLNF